MRLESLKMLVQIQQWSHSDTGVVNVQNSMWIELLVLSFCGRPNIFAVYVYSNVINLTNS